jgi:hypothetical protein
MHRTYTSVAYPVPNVSTMNAQSCYDWQDLLYATIMSTACMISDLVDEPSTAISKTDCS